MAEYSACLRHVDHTWTSTGIQACADINLDIGGGCVHALVGENGAGKTTLGHILAGVRRPDSGLLQKSGKVIDLSDRPIGLLDGIGLVRQRGIWPRDLEIWEAAILGRPERPRSRRKAIDLFNETTERWGLEGLKPRIRISRMDAAALQRAELAAALMFNPDILVLDEPSSAWEEGRASEFRELMEGLKENGRSVILITHRIDDVFRFADTVTVMRHGRIRITCSTRDTDKNRITSEMFGEEGISETGTADRKSVSGFGVRTVPPTRTPEDAIPALAVEDIRLSIAGRLELDSVDFHIHPGEIFSIAGLREEGLSALEDIVTGNRRPTGGRILIKGQEVASGPSGMRRAGLRYIPSDKTGRGSSLDSTMAENMILLDSRRLSQHGFLHPGLMKRWAETRRREGNIDGHPDRPLSELSGGNIQKVILEREFHGRVPVIVAADPTWGLDERSRIAVHDRLRRSAEDGTAILLLASDLDEALTVGDRMAVISSGRLSTDHPTDEWDRSVAARCIAGEAEE